MSSIINLIIFRPNSYHTYHMCHIKTQNMIGMTSMIATAL